MREMNWTWWDLQATPAWVVEHVWAYLQEEAEYRREEMEQAERRIRSKYG